MKYSLFCLDPLQLMAIYCDKCGTENADKAKFCVSCGNNVQLATASTQHNDSQAKSLQDVETKCLWCHQSAGFKEDDGKIDSKWGVTAHKMKMFACNNCGFVHLFSKGRTIFDFD